MQQNHQQHVKSNFHYVTHIFDQMLDYGPVYGFRLFPMERLNKVFKSYKTNCRASGELEVTFLRGFQRDARLQEMVVSLSISNDLATSSVAKTLLETDSDRHGTVAGMARGLEDGTCKISCTHNLHFISFTITNIPVSI